MPRIPSRGNLSSDFPDEFLVAPLGQQGQEEPPAELEEKKLKLIRETYLNHTQHKPKRWDEIAPPPDYFDPSRFCWEVIRDHPADESRNVIYIRRLPKPPGEGTGAHAGEVDFPDDFDAAGWYDGGTDEDETDYDEFLEGEDELEQEETDDGEYAKKKRTRKR